MYEPKHRLHVRVGAPSSIPYSEAVTRWAFMHNHETYESHFARHRSEQ